MFKQGSDILLLFPRPLEGVSSLPARGIAEELVLWLWFFSKDGAQGLIQ